ncbi:phytanoyl-CoA dioxygenase family protein [Paenibacillus sp. strain BS8-2]
MVTEQMKKEYEEQGFTLFHDLFSTEEMEQLTASIDRLDEEREAELDKLGQQGLSIPKQINFNILLNQKDPVVKAFVMQDKMVEITTSLMGPDVKLYWDQSVYKRPEANRDFPWHQDTGYQPIEPQVYITCWLALEDATIENGCIWVIPETHKQGLVEHKDTEVGKQCYFGEDPGLPVELKKGSMAVFNSLLFHRSTPNMSNTTRKGFIMQYSPVGAYNPVSGEVYNNGPDVAVNGHAV